MAENFKENLSNFKKDISNANQNYFNESLFLAKTLKEESNLHNIAKISSQNTKEVNLQIAKSINQAILSFASKELNISEMPYPKHKISPHLVQRPEKFLYIGDSESLFAKKASEIQKSINDLELNLHNIRIDIISKGYKLESNLNEIIDKASNLDDEQVVKELNSFIEKNETYIKEVKDSASKALNIAESIEKNRIKLDEFKEKLTEEKVRIEQEEAKGLPISPKI